MTKKFCTYPTIYDGDLLPKFYIGSSSIEKVNNGYQGSVGSKKYKQIWLDEHKNHPELFDTIVLDEFATRKQALDAENKLQHSVNIPFNTDYINQACANPNGFHGHDVKGLNNPRFGAIISQEQRDKISKANKGKIPHNKGKKIPLTDEQKDRYKSGIEHHMFGKKRPGHSAKMKGRVTRVYRKATPEERLAASIRGSGNNNNNARITIINGITYGSRKEAMKKLGLSGPTLRKMISNG